METRVGKSIVLIFIMCLIPLSYIFRISDFFLIGFMAISFIVMGFKIHLPHHLRKVNVLFLLYFAWMCVLLIKNISEGGIVSDITRIVQFLACYFAWYMGVIYEWPQSQIVWIKRLIGIVLVIIAAHWILTGAQFSDYLFLMHNPNCFALLMFCWIVFFDIFYEGITSDKVAIILLIFFVLISSCRGVLAALLIYFALSRFFGKLNDSNRLYSISRIIYIIEMVILFSWTIFYTILDTTSIGKKIELYSMRLFNKNLFSGRQNVWPFVIELIKNQPVIGYGLSASPSSILGIPISCHSLYLQTALQGGLVLLSILVLLVSEIIKTIAKSSCNVKIVALVIAYMFNEAFEITLTQNLLPVGIIAWFIFGLGCKTKNNEID